MTSEAQVVLYVGQLANSWITLVFSSSRSLGYHLTGFRLCFVLERKVSPFILEAQVRMHAD
jgi:hypothetical protein